MARADDQTSDVRAVGGRVDRRVVLKATASLAAMAALAVGAPRHRAVAQDTEEAPETRAATWYEADGLAAYTMAGGQDSVLQAEFPFYAIAPHWDGEAGRWPRIEMSFSRDGSTWSDSIVAAASDHDAGRPDRGGRAFGRLVFTGQNSFFRYRALDEAGGAIQVPGLAFTYIDASAGPTIDDVYSAALSPSLAQPPIISRNAWGANEQYRFEDGRIAWPPDYRAIEHVILHHTETPNFEDPLVAIRSVYYYHAVTRGWGDIGYNYLVDFMGNVYEGRYGGEYVVGGHAYQYAYGSAGIGAMGRFWDEAATPEMQAGLVWITAWLARNLDPYGAADFHQVPNLPTICAHRDVNETDCPGDFLYGELQAVRNHVSAVLYEGLAPGPAAGEFLPGDAVEVVVEEASLRSSPGLDGWVAATLPLGTVLTVADGPTTTGGYVWYQVAGAAGFGWCASIVLRVTDKVPPPIAGEYAAGDEVIVATDALKLRNAPALAGAVLAILPTGTAATIVSGPVLADGYRWYEIGSDYGTGWSVAEFLAPPGSALPPPPDAAFSVGDTVVVDTDSLSLREAPGTMSPLVAVLPSGTTGTVLSGPEWSDGTAWYQIETELGGGWCVAGYLGSLPDTEVGGDFAAGDRVVVATDALTLRSQPSMEAAVLAVMTDGTRLTITGGPESGNGARWYSVSSTTYGEGWSAGEYLEADADGGTGFASGEQVRVVDGELNLRSEPSLSASVVAILPDGTELTIDYGPSNHDGYDWWFVEGTSGGGWAVGTFLAPV